MKKQLRLLSIGLAGAVTMLAMNDALNNAVPIFKTYALDNRRVYFKDISKK